MGLEHLTLLDEEGRDVVPEAMQCRPVCTTALRKAGESVPERTGRQACAMVEVRAEKPWPEWAA